MRWGLVRAIGLWLLGIVLAVLLVATTATLWAIRRAFPQQSGELTLPGLSAAVSVYRDAHGVPQVYARTEEDLFRAQGYLHAQDRFWEMDVRRHVTAGRLSEMFGSGQVATDAFLRTLGWRRVAQQEWDLATPATRAYLTAYADGVNAWIRANPGNSRKSLEYSVLGLTNPSYTVEPWDPVDSIAWLKAMAWDLRGNMTSELGRARLLASGLSHAQVESLYPEYPYQRNAPIIAGGTVVGGTFDASAPAPLASLAPQLNQLSTLLDGMPNLLGDGGAGIGSNSWVVAGKFTTTGKPLLANDPHLSVSMPGIWYQMGMHCACGYNVEGFTFSGVPGVVIGHNDRIAWGFTNLDPDVTDLFVERIDGERVYDGTAWVPLTTRTETIKVAGASPVSITVRASKHGPLLSDRSTDLFDVATHPPVAATPSPSPQPSASLQADAAGVPDAAASGPYAIALQWTALQPTRVIDALFSLNRAGNWSEFRAAASLFDVPAQNLVYADVDGNIGYQAPGLVPVRGAGDGRWPAPGWDPAYDWKGTIPFDAMPSVFNPAEGFIVTANQAVVGPSYPFLLTTDWSYGYRSQRIRDLLTAKLATGKVSAEDIRQMQFDNANTFAPTLIRVLRDVSFPDLPAPFGDAVTLLQDWDTQQGEDSAGAALYNVFWRHLLALTFDELPADQRPDGDDRWFEVMRKLLNDPLSAWWDDQATSFVENRDQILWRALRDAVDELTQRFGADPKGWRWGDLHTLELRHGTLGESGIAPIEWLFNRGPEGVSGGPSIVDATSWEADKGYETTAGPSMRMIVDLANFNDSRWIQLTGNSGHAFHPNYADQFELWRHGDNLPMRWDRTTIADEATEILVLNP